MTWTSRAFRSLLAAASVLCVALAAAPAGAQCQGSTGGACPWGLTEYATETVFGQGSTTGIRVGPDGALWFVQPDTTHKLGRITTGGQVTYPLANPTFDGNVAPSVQTASGPITSVTGGALWIPYSQTLVQMPTDGSPGLHYFSDAQKPPAASPYHQVSAIGWDGATMIRFVDFVNGSKLGSFDLSKGTLAEVAFPPCPGPVSERTEVNSIGADMALAPDGGLWLSGFANATRIARDGTVSCVSMPKFTSDGITYSPYDRRIWVSAHAHPNFLQAFDPTTCHDAGCVSVYTLPAPVGELHGLTAGPDGRIWFVGGNPELIGSVMTDGSDFQYVNLPHAGSNPGRIVAGPTGDNSVWFTETGGNRIGRITALTPAPQTALYLQNGRFKVEVSWKVPPQGTSGDGTPVPIVADTGAFWFFTSNNLENMIKVLDGRAINGKWWVFYGALSNVEYTIKITDLVTGAVVTYHNPYGSLASVSDTGAFSEYSPPQEEAKEAPLAPTGFDPADLVRAEQPQGRSVLQERTEAVCAPDPQSLCLTSNRFKVQVAWHVPSQGTNGVGTATALTPDTGDFWFFSSNNLELIIKVLDARAINNHFWVFYGALSNVEYTITITDTQTGTVKQYHNPDQTQASVADTSAF